MNIIKSPNDPNSYVQFKLSNKLQVFFEHNEQIKLSCVMIVVKIGYMLDKFSGMAHFLEHMLFNGTAKYPEEKYFSQFITKNGGYTNAFTTHENTCYYYTIDTNALEQSLEIFSQFFIHPLFDSNTVNREREAVNAEHEKNLNDDGWRFQNVLKQVVNKNNTFGKFSTGSNSTLDIDNINEEIRELFNLYYSSDLMTLFVVTNADAKNIINSIKSNFSEITIKSKPNMPDKNLPIFDVPKTLYIVPISDITKITLCWELPAFKKSPQSNPIDFISYLLNHEGHKTLHHVLTENGYILNFHSGTYESIGNKSIFYIDISLNNEDDISNVINVVFHYIQLIGNSDLTELYNEQQTFKKYKFEFEEQYDPVDKCMSYYDVISSCDLSLDYMLVINYLDDSFDNIKKIVNMLTPNRCMCVLTSKTYDSIAVNVDQHYGTKYHITDDKIKVGTCDFQLSLPKKNQYMRFGRIINKDNDEIPIKKNIGYLFRTNLFNNPDININICIYLPLSIIDKCIYTQTLIYFASILQNVRNEKYIAMSAGYNFDITFDMGKLNIELQGNYKQMSRLCKFLVKSLNKPQFTLNEFELTRNSFKMNDKNLSFDAPYVRISNYFNKHTLLKYYTNSDRLECYDTLSYEKTKNTHKVFELGTFDLLITGNCSETLFNQLSSILVQLKPKNKYKSNHLLESINVKFNISRKLTIAKENPHEKNNAVGTYLEISPFTYVEKYMHNLCMLNVVQKFISQEYFYQLRTQEKFGYIVGSGLILISTGPSYYLYSRFIVQSPHKTTNEMIERTTLFIETFKSTIDSISEIEFEQVIKSCIKIQEEPETNLNMLANEKMNELQHRIKSFNYKKKLIECYKCLKLSDIRKFYFDKFCSNPKLFVCM